MRKNILWLLLVAVAAIIWWNSLAPTLRNPHASNKQPKVVVSGYVPYTLTHQLAGPFVQVSMLLPPNAEPHAFEPTPGALVSIKNADAFIYMSDTLEPWAADLAQVAPQSAPVVALAQAIPGQTDPHVWMKFSNVKQLADSVADTLIRIDPEHRVQYTENLASLQQELDQLMQAYQTALADCKTREVVHIGHLAFKNLTDDYGLTLTALSGASHEGEHSAKKLAQLMGKIKKSGVHTIFTEETLSDRLAQTVAQETGTSILPLYPVEHISKQDFQNQVTYGELMRRNLENLKRGLQCPAS